MLSKFASALKLQEVRTADYSRQDTASLWHIPGAALLTAALLLGLAGQSVSAQGQNNFFGSSVPGNVPSAANPPTTGGSGGDYSDDEKRMQKKFKSNLQHAKDLVTRGDAMMKKGESKKDDKSYKRGKILKEIGEKQLLELQSNNPFPDTKDNKKNPAQ